MLEILKLTNPKSRNRLQVYLATGQGDPNNVDTVERAVFAPSTNAAQALVNIQDKQVTKYLGVKTPTLWRISSEDDGDGATWQRIKDVSGDYNYDLIAEIVESLRRLLFVDGGVRDLSKLSNIAIFSRLREVIEAHYNIEIQTASQSDPLSSLLRVCYTAATKLDGKLTPTWWESVSALNVTCTTANTVNIVKLIVDSLIDRELEFRIANCVDDTGWDNDSQQYELFTSPNSRKWHYRIKKCDPYFGNNKGLKFQNTLWRLKGENGHQYFTANQLPRSEELTTYLAHNGNERCKLALETDALPNKALGEVYSHNLLGNSELLAELKKLPLQVHVGDYCWIDFDCTAANTIGSVHDEARLRYDIARKASLNKYGLSSFGTKLMHPLTQYGEVSPLRRELVNWFNWCDSTPFEFTELGGGDSNSAPQAEVKKPTRPTVKIKNAPKRATIRTQDFDEIYDVAVLEFKSVCKKVSKKFGITLPKMKFEQFYDTQGRFREFAIIENGEGSPLVEINIGYNLNKINLEEDESTPTIHYCNPRLDIDDTYHLNGYLRQRAIEVVSDYLASQPLSFSEKLVQHQAVDSSDINKKRSLTSKLIDILQ